MSILERDCVLVSKDESGNTIIDMPVTRVNNVEGLGRNPGTAYSVGDVVMCNGSRKLQLICITAGTTSTSDLDISSNKAGDNITDGDVVWAVKPKSDISSIVDIVYPVGSLYWSKNPTSPKTLFGGTWTQIKDKFILAAGDTYAVGSTGGAATVALSVAQLPAHSHSGSAQSNGSHNHSASSNSTGGHTHTFGVDEGWNGTRFIAGSNEHRNGNLTSSSAGSHSHTISVGNGGAHTHTLSINNTGSGQAHENMPPYVTYYCWERTA